MLYACVKLYEKDDREFCDWHFKTSSHDNIYNKVMELNGSNHTEAVEIASWCENASKEEIWEFANGAGEVEIQNLD